MLEHQGIGVVACGIDPRNQLSQAACIGHGFAGRKQAAKILRGVTTGACVGPDGQPTMSCSTSGESVARTPSTSSWASKAKCRSEEHTSELQSLMRISYAVFCLKKKKKDKSKENVENTI